MAMSRTLRIHKFTLPTQSWVIAAIALFTSFVLGAEQASAACGEVAIAKGDIKVENGKTKKAEVGVKGTKVCQGDAIVAGPMSRAKIVMEDGNELNISPDSRIVLEQYEYKPSDNKKKVMLNVLYGKVRAATKEENMYGDKAADGQANAFQVKTKSAVAGVRGTDFLTSFDRTSKKSEVVTFRGKVDVGTPGANGAILNPVSVSAGQKTEALPGAPPAPPKPVPPREMEKMNAETKSDVAAGPKDNGNTPAQSDSGKEKDSAKDASKDPGSDSSGTASGDKKDGGKNDANNGNSGNANAAPGDKKDDGKKDSGSANNGGGGRNAGGGGATGGGAVGGPPSSDGSDKGSDNKGGMTNGRGSNAGAPGSGTPGSGGAVAGPNSGNAQNGQPPPQRAPSSLPGGSMINAGDLGKAPGQSPVLPTMPVVPIYAPPVIGTVPVVAPVCDLCNRAIESGPGQVKITITIPN